METEIVKLAPSILAADFARLGEQVTEAVAWRNQLQLTLRNGR
jgi:pentose-5-phosphate-3-epimerase